MSTARIHPKTAPPQGAMVRTAQEWDASEQGRILAARPTVEIIKMNGWPESYEGLNAEKRGLRGMFKDKEFTKEDYARAILMKYYKDTMALSKGAAIANVSFDKSAYFFSEIRTEQNEDGEIIPRLISTKGSHELDYSYGEYRAFIERFREIARKMPDEVKEEQEFRGVKG